MRKSPERDREEKTYSGKIKKEYKMLADLAELHFSEEA